MAFLEKVALRRSAMFRHRVENVTISLYVTIRDAPKLCAFAPLGLALTRAPTKPSNGLYRINGKSGDLPIAWHAAVRRSTGISPNLSCSGEDPYPIRHTHEFTLNMEDRTPTPTPLVC